MFQLLFLALDFFTLALFVYVVLSWIRNPTTDQARMWLGRFFEPILRPIRQLLGTINLGGMGLDLAPLVLFLAVIVLRRLLSGMLVPTF